MTWRSRLAYLGQPLELLHSSNARTAILHVMINAIRVLEPGAFLSILIHLFHVYYTNLLPTLNTYLFHSLDGTKRQSIKDMDGNLLHPKIQACSISSPFVLIVKEDDSIGPFMGETEHGNIGERMSPMGDKVRIHLDSHRSDGADYSFFLFSSLDLEIPDRLLLRRHVQDVGEATQK